MLWKDQENKEQTAFSWINKPDPLEPMRHQLRFKSTLSGLGDYGLCLPIEIDQQYSLPNPTQTTWNFNPFSQLNTLAIIPIDPRPVTPTSLSRSECDGEID